MRRPADAKSQSFGGHGFYDCKLGTGKLPSESMFLGSNVVSFQIIALVHFPIKFIRRIDERLGFKYREFGEGRGFDEDYGSHMSVPRPEIFDSFIPDRQDFVSDSLRFSLHIPFVERIGRRITPGNEANF